MIVNPDSPIRLIYDYIREIFAIPGEKEIDLCDEGGNLVFIYEKEPWEFGTSFLKLRSVYFVVLFDKDENGKLINPVLNVPSDVLSSTAQLNEIRHRIGKQLNPSASSRNIGSARTRSASIKINPS